MRILGKVKKIREDKIEFIPMDVFPEEIIPFKRIKGKIIYIEPRDELEESDLVVLGEEETHSILFKDFRPRRNLYFSKERGRFYVVLENKYIKLYIDPERSGRVDYLLDKRNNFQWFFDDFVYSDGKLSRCGISQGFKERNLFEKKLDYRFNKKEFYGVLERKEFIFEKRLQLEGQRPSFVVSFSLKFKEKRDFYPFYEIKVFAGKEIYKYAVKLKRENQKVVLPLLNYPFQGWSYSEDFGRVKEVVYTKDKNRVFLKPSLKDLVNYKIDFSINFFNNRFFYRKIKGEKNKKLELRLRVGV